MAIWQGDVFFRRVIELILREVRQNPWLIDDILSDFVTDPMLINIYGQKEIQNAKKWFNDNEVSVFLSHRMDFEKMPCVTISIGNNVEDKSLSRLADMTPFVETLQPDQVGRSINYIISPFEYISYDQPTGFFLVPEEVNLTLVQPGMVLIDVNDGVGFVITNKTANGVFIAPGTEVTFTQIGIIPQYMIFRARREIATFQESVSIGCHTHGDPNTLLWLYSIVMYGLLRYREGIFETRNFQLSNLQTTEMIRNDAFQEIGENVYSRFINISGQVENTWIKAPKSIIETINIAENTSGIYTAGLVIVGKDGAEVPEIVDAEEETWIAETDPE